MVNGLRVLMISSEWPTPERPHAVPFIVRQVELLRKAGVDLRLFIFQGGKNPVRYARAGFYKLFLARWPVRPIR